MLVDDFDPLKGQMLQILDREGNVNKELEPKIDAEMLVRAYKAMMLTRIGDEKAVRLQRQGRMGAYPPSKGQEASQIGPAMALDKDDWTVWAFREMGALLWRGVPLWQQYLYWMGNEEGSNYAEGVNVTPSVVPVGSQVPHAVGIAYAMKYRKEKSAVLCFFGDGATSEGDFHEALNFSGVLRTPNIFVCQNNQYAISLPRERQTAARSLAQKAVAYGIPGIQVDGNDVLALYAAAVEAAARARSGGGPTLIESYTYRLGDHTTSDDATRYRKEQELTYWEARDPIARFRTYLKERKLWDDGKEQAYRTAAEAEVEEAVKKAESFPPPTIEDAFRFTYQTMSVNLKEQIEFLRRDLSGKGDG
ncbi:MAG TPA: pyruvate dehydrogenase (acetyl-transferring) E1 component subunit alpha [Methanomassiliicoccales archaeon]|nr:pyruvate dehydrogenase (acetyl-transferring) E1 component subunit alpha [Methanomassiliicoccales archaeon]